MTIGSTIWRTPETTDSMAWARESCFQASDGAFFIPDKYVAAQGRSNRTWYLAEGQLTKTLLLKPTNIEKETSKSLALLAMALAVGIVTPLKKFGVALKWPNDFMLNNKKLGGIRIDVVWLANNPYACIVGYSLNINNIFNPTHPLKERAISLHEATNALYDIPLLDQEITAALNAIYTQWQAHDHITIFNEWQALQLYHNEPLSVHRYDGTQVTGIVSGFTTNGDLLLQVNNKQETIPFFAVQETNTTHVHNLPSPL